MKTRFTLFVVIWLTLLGRLADARQVEIGLAALKTDGHLPSAQEIEQFEHDLGHAVDTINWFLGFNADTGEFPVFPLRELQKNVRRGIVPMLTLEPWGNTRAADGNPASSLKGITDGKADSYFASLAQAMKAYGRPIRLRFGHEMIQDDNPQTGYPSPQWYPWQDDPQSYKAAYIRLYSVIKKEGADNVEFVWSPNFQPFYQDMLAKYYPGPQFVDWIGIDGYNWANGDFDSIFKRIYENIVGHPEVYGDKPVMITEIGAGRDPASARLFNKAMWIKQAFKRIEEQYTKISAFYWFNVKKERDWRLNESPESWQAFKEAMAADIYAGQ